MINNADTTPSSDRSVKNAVGRSILRKGRRQPFMLRKALSRTALG
jgi:hypothetical protein